jgi:hypothetical protein
MAETIYFLCGITSIMCAVLLLRGYRRSRVHLLMWSSLCFLGLAINNVLLLVDLVMLPDVDLSFWRGSAALAGLAPLVFGLIWES